MKADRVISVVLLSLTVMVAGCSKLGGRSPSEVVTRVHTACNEGKYSEAQDHFSSSTKALINGPLGAAAGGMKGLCDKQTRKGALPRVEILKENIRGEGATVDYRLHFKDGTTKEDHDDLIKEDGQWKEAISPPGG
jgi:hypothetical protein